MQTSSVQSRSYIPTQGSTHVASATSSSPVPQDRVTIGQTIPDHNCWDPRTWGKKEPSQAPGASQEVQGNSQGVRAEMTASLDRLAQSDCTGIVHTTRGLPMESMHTPQAPQGFAAGRFAVTFRDRQTGEEQGFIFETEAGPGHLAPVTPGVTEISGGYVSLLADPKDPWGAATTLNRAEMDRLIDRIYERFASPMEDQQAEKLESALSYGLAIRYSGQGSAPVTARYQQELARLQA